ncbi:MAG TPA: hypothetical protein VGN84_09520 [Solirubrobacterales bacterium]|jgi:hypothetical protein|nr:hypothetical protein [Solirubrobacterales bacterium]
MRTWLACSTLIAVLAGMALFVPQGAGAFDFLPEKEGFDAHVYAEGERVATQAGSHPVALTASFGFPFEGGGPFTEGDLRNLSFELPPGLIENPTSTTTAGICSQADFHVPRSSPFEKSLSGESCQDKSQIGIATVRSSFGGGTTRTFGVFNLSPPPGVPSEIGLNPYGDPIVFTPSIRQAEGEYGITLETRNVPQLVDVSGLTLTIWGVPWSLLHDTQRGDCLNETEPALFGWAKCSVGRPAKSENAPRAYLTMPTSCEKPMAFTSTAESWQQPDTVTRTVEEKAPLEGCKKLAFEPQALAQLSDPRASSPSGYRFDIKVNTLGVTAPGCCAPTPVRKAVVTLPEGVTINPSVGSGLGVCSPGQFRAETPSSLPGAGCPSEAKIGDFSVTSPIVSGAIGGSIFLAAPYQNPFSSLIAVYLVAKSLDRGILVKVTGELKADPGTGRLTATFDKLPQLPYSELSIHFREGQRSPLATPAACGSVSTEADLTPWRDPDLVRHTSLPASITAGVGGGACPSGLAPFAPQAKGGTLNSNAGSYTPFYLHLTRQDTEQEIVSYSAQFPPGLLGKIAGIPYCSDAAIEAARQRSGAAERDQPSCPAASLIGRTYSGYGVGSVLAYAPGNLYLAGPYRGSSFSVVAIDSALVGPFDLGVAIVRSAIRIDPQTAQASIDATGTDPIPHIVKGIPIHLRDVRAYMDRPNFTLNPTSCDPFTLASALNGAGQRFADQSDDTLAVAPAHFQAFNCSSLGFKPRISMRLKGGTKHGKYPSLRVVVRPRPGDANVASSQIALPDSLFLDQGHIKTICTRLQFASKNCPAGSVYGHVRAFTPLLGAPMEGQAYLRSSNNPLPDLVFALRGQGIEVDLAGRIDAVKGGLRGTFPTIPDAPVTKFVLRMNSGRRGVLVNAEDLCAKSQLAMARFVGHANHGTLTDPEVTAQCGGERPKRHAKHEAKQKGAGR